MADNSNERGVRRSGGRVGGHPVLNRVDFTPQGLYWGHGFINLLVPAYWTVCCTPGSLGRKRVLCRRNTYCHCLLRIFAYMFRYVHDMRWDIVVSFTACSVYWYQKLTLSNNNNFLQLLTENIQLLIQ